METFSSRMQATRLLTRSSVNRVGAKSAQRPKVTYSRAAEIINGRSAMVGWTSGLGLWAVQGRDIVSQVHDPGVMLGAVVTTALVALGSFTTLEERVGMDDIDDVSDQGMWTSTAENLNGRVAMVAAGVATATSFL